MMRMDNNVNASNEYGLSIIIPTYNAEKYIAECLESVLTQVTDSSVEIICVDDGSVDGTVALVKEYAKKYTSIRLYCKNHEGAGVARNLGLSVAVKKYVSFLDADDYYDEGAMDKIREACISSKESIIGFAYWKFLDNHDMRKEKVVGFSDDLIIPKQGKRIKVSEWQNDYGYTNFVFDREFISKHNLHFPTYMRYEDPVFLIRALMCANYFRLLPSSIYVCRIGYKDSSEMDRTIDDILRGIRDNLTLAYEAGFEGLRENLLRRTQEEFYESIYRGMNDETMKLLLEISAINNRFENKKEFKILTDIYKGKAANKIAERNHKRDRDIIRDYRIFDNVSECMKKNGGFGAFLISSGIKKVCIYGAGLYGRLLAWDFMLHGVKVVSVIDRNNEGYAEEIKIAHPDDIVPDSDLLIVALRDAAAVVDDLRKRGIHNTIGIQDLTDKMLDCQNIF